jgi:hypothetical protein
MALLDRRFDQCLSLAVRIMSADRVFRSFDGNLRRKRAMKRKRVMKGGKPLK